MTGRRDPDRATRRSGGIQGRETEFSRAWNSSQISLGIRAPTGSGKFGNLQTPPPFFPVDGAQFRQGFLGHPQPVLVEAPCPGTNPIGVSRAPSEPAAAALAMIHFRVRMFSPKPGQMNLPFSSLRNQLMKKIFGGRGARLPRFPLPSEHFRRAAVRYPLPPGVRGLRFPGPRWGTGSGRRNSPSRSSSCGGWF